MDARFVALAFLVALALPQGAAPDSLLLENGIRLELKEIEAARMLPHVYYDQAMTSIPKLYPGAQIIAKRRYGLLGRHPQRAYSLIAYRKSRQHDRVSIGGVATAGQDAWSFNADAEAAAFAETLMLVLEALPALPAPAAAQ